MDVEDAGGDVALFIGSDGSSFVQLSDFGTDPASRVREYYKIGGMDFLLTGGEIGDSAYRVGTTTDELMKSYPVSFDDTRLTSMGGIPTADGTGLFVFGGAVSGPADAPEIIPAQFMAGTIANEDLETFAETVPPAGLTPGGELTGISDIFVFDSLISRGELYYQVGASFAPADRVALTLLQSDGSFLVQNFIVAEKPGDNLSNAAIARLGIGMVVTYRHNDELKARPVLCGPE